METNEPLNDFLDRFAAALYDQTIELELGDGNIVEFDSLVAVKHLFEEYKKTRGDSAYLIYRAGAIYAEYLENIKTNPQ